MSLGLKLLCCHPTAPPAPADSALPLTPLCCPGDNFVKMVMGKLGPQQVGRLPLARWPAGQPCSPAAGRCRLLCDVLASRHSLLRYHRLYCRRS